VTQSSYKTISFDTKEGSCMLIDDDDDDDIDHANGTKAFNFKPTSHL
jgi:hypothetical protein